MQVLARAAILSDPNPVPEPARFTGDAYSTAVQAGEVSTASATLIRLDPGVRGHWHRHSEGQVINVINGAGLIGRRGSRAVSLAAGDTVWIEPDEEHWHGAAPETHVAYLAISYGAITWLESSA
jgi:quercetin dioxygenase-like cupin family protein